MYFGKVMAAQMYKSIQTKVKRYERRRSIWFRRNKQTMRKCARCSMLTYSTLTCICTCRIFFLMSGENRTTYDNVDRLSQTASITTELTSNAHTPQNMRQENEEDPQRKDYNDGELTIVEYAHSSPSMFTAPCLQCTSSI